jgi:hypothetical protein
MAGYTRVDTTNQIQNGNVIDAVALDGEFDALQTAFGAAGGHVHDGAIGNGAPITKVGPTQDLIVSGTTALPKTDNTLDLGSTSFEFKDLWIDGVANIDSLIADTADINAGTIDATVIGATTPAAVTTTSLIATTADINGGTIDATVIGGTTPAAASVTTLNASGIITGSVVGSIVGTHTGIVTGTTGTFSGTLGVTGATTLGATTAASLALTTDLPVTEGGTGASTASAARTNLGLGTMSTQDASAVTITGGTFSGTSVTTSGAATIGGVLAVTGVTTTPSIGLNTTTSSTQRIRSASNETLLSHDGTSHLLKVNKASGTDTASLVFQSGLSTRAEIGNIGSQTLRIRVSPDGSTFFDGVLIDQTNGVVSVNTANNIVYARSNIIGTVTESAGIPTGALMESISNANGRAWKFATGLLICTHDLLSSNSAGVTWTYPSPFIVSPNVNVTCSSSIGSRSGQTDGLPGTTSMVFSVWRPDDSRASTLTTQLTAIGRWF